MHSICEWSWQIVPESKLFACACSPLFAYHGSGRFFFSARISKLIKERLKSLEEALQTRDQLGESIEEATEWMEDVQADLRKIPRSIGPTVNEAEEILKKYEVFPFFHLNCGKYI